MAIVPALGHRLQLGPPGCAHGGCTRSPPIGINRGLPPPVHAPSPSRPARPVRFHPRRRSAPWPVEGPGPQMGRHGTAATTSTPTSTTTRHSPHSARRRLPWPCLRGIWRAPHSAGFFEPDPPQPRPLWSPDLARGPRHADRPANSSPLWAILGLLIPARPGRCCFDALVDRACCSDSSGGGLARVFPGPPHHLEHQLRSATSGARSPSRSHDEKPQQPDLRRPGPGRRLAQTNPPTAFPRLRPPRAWLGGSSTPATGSSAAWSCSAWPSASGVPSRATIEAKAGPLNRVGLLPRTRIGRIGPIRTYVAPAAPTAFARAPPTRRISLPAQPFRCARRARLPLSRAAPHATLFIRINTRRVAHPQTPARASIVAISPHPAPHGPSHPRSPPVDPRIAIAPARSQPRPRPRSFRPSKRPAGGPADCRGPVPSTVRAAHRALSHELNNLLGRLHALPVRSPSGP